MPTRGPGSLRPSNGTMPNPGLPDILTEKKT